MRQHLPAAAQHKIYFDYGDQTLDAMYPLLQQKVDQLMRQLKYPKTLWQTRVFPGADHSETAWSQRLHIPLEFLLAPSVDLLEQSLTEDSADRTIVFHLLYRALYPR